MVYRYTEHQVDRYVINIIYDVVLICFVAGMSQLGTELD